MTPFMAHDGSGIVVLVDAENVRRSRWPNLSPEELEARCEAWSAATGNTVEVVWEGAESADDTIARRATELDRYWLVTSDRELRERAGGAAERVVGGGSFLRELLGEP
jgi:hypothetical protein